MERRWSGGGGRTGGGRIWALAVGVGLAGGEAVVVRFEVAFKHSPRQRAGDHDEVRIRLAHGRQHRSRRATCCTSYFCRNGSAPRGSKQFSKTADRDTPIGISALLLHFVEFVRSDTHSSGVTPPCRSGTAAPTSVHRPRCSPPPYLPATLRQRCYAPFTTTLDSTSRHLTIQ